MPSYVDSLVVFRQSENVAKVLMSISQLFSDAGLQFMPDTCVVFNNSDDNEREPVYVSSKEEAVKCIAAWPLLGGMEYYWGGRKIILFLQGLSEFSVDAVTISSMSSDYHNHPAIKAKYDEIVREVHDAFRAKRTISDIELLSPNSFWKQEVGRLIHNQFIGDYPIDLR
jgi:hypothetical protein